MAKTDIENTQDTNAIGVVCSALVRPSFVFGTDDDGHPDFRALIGPGGWECYLGEPEDALWCRDGQDAMTMINELAARVKILSEFAMTAPGRLPASVQSALWPNKVVGPAAVIALFKVQAVHRQRREDADKPKAALQVPDRTREQAQRIADELCCYVCWGTEHIAPKINA